MSAEDPAEFEKKIPGSKGSARKKVHRRVCYSPFPVWEDGFIHGAGFLNLLDRDSLRVNLNVVIYSNGKYPYFKKNRIEAAYTVRIPLPVIEDLYRRIQAKGVRVRQDPRHKWKIRKFRAGGPGT